MSLPGERWAEPIGRRIRLRDLRLLLAVIQCGSMAKAARRISLSQPAISKTISDLEHALGVRLLDRGPQGIEPTLYGRALVRRAVTVFDELRQAVSELEFLANPSIGEVRIGCNDSLSVALLPEVIERLSTEHPGIIPHVTQMSRPITVEIEHLRDRAVDLIIGRGIFPIPEDDLNAEILFEERLVVVASLQSSWVRRRKLRLADLTEAKWIAFPPQEGPNLLVQQAFLAQGLDTPRPSVTTSSFHLRDALLATGNYLTVVPECMLRVFNAKALSVKVLPIDLAIPIRQVALFTLKNRTLNPAAEILIDCVRAVASTFRD